MRVLVNRRVPMPDGVELATDVYLPSGPGPFPTVIARSPYHRLGESGTGPRFVERGYAYVAQDVRGKFDSDGAFTPLVDDETDGHATIDWAANQRWCNGRIGLWGRSYLGMVQFFAASQGHEALRCIVPSVHPVHLGTQSWGDRIRWTLLYGTCRTAANVRHFNWGDAITSRTFDEVERRTGIDTTRLREWASLEPRDEDWKRADPARRYSRIAVPGLHSGGWWDHAGNGVFAAYTGLRASAATSRAREGQRLIAGPWGHGTTGAMGEEHMRYGSWEFGAAADYDVFAAELRCMDHYVREMDNGWDREPNVRAFLMGIPGDSEANRWLEPERWPPPDAPLALHLHSDGPGRGLAPEPPSENGVDSYRYDPANPVPVFGGVISPLYAVVGPTDQRRILNRPDVLYYRGDRLNHVVDVAGDVSATLTVAIDAEDSDLVTKLCVELDTGEVYVLLNGYLALRYRENPEMPRPLTPNEPVTVTVGMGRTAFRFPAGSRIGLIVTSSEFPRLPPHRNVYAGILEDAQPRPARVSILHGPETQSYLTLPVIES